MNNIFVLCPGRCGSMTFARACEHATNYSVGHESIGLRHGLEYPAQHIEVNNRLVWFLGLLHVKYPDARYVHLTRDPEAVAASYAKRARSDQAIAHAWRRAIRCGWHARNRHDEERPLEVDCREYVDAVNANIRLFLGAYKPSDHTNVSIDNPESFAAFWAWADLTGDYDAAMQAFRQRHNASR